MFIHCVAIQETADFEAENQEQPNCEELLQILGNDHDNPDDQDALQSDMKSKQFLF